MTVHACRRCGATTEAEGDLPLGWSSATDDGRVDLLCDRCTRDHVRDIEGKLDETWWT